MSACTRVPSNVPGILGPSQEWLDEQNRARGLPVDPVMPSAPDWVAGREVTPLISNIRPDCPPWVFAHFGKGLDDVQRGASELDDYCDVDQLFAIRPPEMLVEGLLPQQSLGYITGRDGTFKTFLALDLALHIVTDRPTWHGREVDFTGYGRVLYIAGEGAASFGIRIKAWCAHHRVELQPWEKKRLMVKRSAVDLYAAGEKYDELLERVRVWEPDLIVVDTLRRSSGRAEANSATEMGVVTDRIEQLKRTSGGTVLVIAHTDKGDNDARGSSSIEDDADFVLHCKRDADRLRVKVAKLKDGEDKHEIVLRPVRVADSLALADEAPDAVWSSATLDNRIAAVIRLQAPALGAQSRAQIEEGLAGDSHEVPSKASLNRMLASMAKEGRLVVTKTGQTARYEVDETWTPPNPWPHVPVIEDDTTGEEEAA